MVFQDFNLKYNSRGMTTLKYDYDFHVTQFVQFYFVCRVNLLQLDRFYLVYKL